MLKYWHQVLESLNTPVQCTRWGMNPTGDNLNITMALKESKVNDLYITLASWLLRRCYIVSIHCYVHAHKPHSKMEHLPCQVSYEFWRESSSVTYFDTWAWQSCATSIIAKPNTENNLKIHDVSLRNHTCSITKNIQPNHTFSYWSDGTHSTH